MKKLLIPVFLTITLIGCSENDQFAAEEYEPADENDDRETLIATNERLVEQLGKYSEKNEEMQEELEALEEENDKLKNDIITYRQQMHEARDEKEEELALRTEIDQLAGHFFEALHRRDGEKLRDLTADQVEVDMEQEQFTVTPENQIELSFEFDNLNFSEIEFLSMHEAEYDRSRNRYRAEYSFTVLNDNKGDFETESRMVEMEFVQNEDGSGTWKIASIQNR
ncbi:hypothetical protein [Alteribacter natronophilus]|uniref:hypothetical protein n=1 Tax=Alteribacter natronophilus TaxID=2583810 RepID=UPI00110D2B69|nr:hypothetical protein [Alteribacter natronophilus]TMW71534.1 hypothetical protein FGB90_10870 [Alteribacter natronophilus]